jgi:hypothetical protein
MIKQKSDYPLRTQNEMENGVPWMFLSFSPKQVRDQDLIKKKQKIEPA